MKFLLLLLFSHIVLAKPVCEQVFETGKPLKKQNISLQNQALDMLNKYVVEISRVGSEKGQGYGFLIGEEILVTNYSVVSRLVPETGGYLPVDIKFMNGRKDRAHVIIEDSINDIAILRVPGQTRGFQMKRYKDVEIGEDMFVYNMLSTGKFFVSEGKVNVKISKWFSGNKIRGSTLTDQHPPASGRLVGMPVLGNNLKVIGLTRDTSRVAAKSGEWMTLTDMVSSGTIKKLITKYRARMKLGTGS